MRITHHGLYLTQITRFPRFFPINTYLVREEERLTLIDTGIPGMAKEIVQIAQGLGLPITTIALTHAHGDHVGSLDALHALLPNAEVAISARDARLLGGDMGLQPAEPQTKPRGSFQKVATAPTRLLGIGEHIGSLRVVAAPGHTPGQIALYDERDGSLIAGDAFHTRTGVTVAGTMRLAFPFPAIATWHYPTALASARALRELRPTRLAVGHGDVAEQPLAAMDAAIAVAARDLEQKELAHGA